MFSFEIDPLHYVIAFVTSTIALYKIFLKPKLDRWSRRLDHLDKIPQIEESVSNIKKQVFPNGGGSVVDGLDRMERRIVAIEEKQNIYLMDVHHGLFEADTNGKWISVNRTLCRMLLCTEKELIGRGWMNFMSADTIERYNHCVSNEIEFRGSALLKTALGNNMSVSITANPLKSNLDKKLVGYIGTIDETIE